MLAEKKQNAALHKQQQAHLAEAAKASVAMRELASQDRKHRVHALLWAFTAWRARRRGDAVEGYRSWDH